MTTTAEPTTIDQAKAEAFAGQMLGIINNGALMSMVSIGHRTGLWDKLATLPPSTSDEIAKATGWQRHTVRGAIAGAVKRKLGLKVVTEDRDGIRVYRIAGR